MPRGGGWDPDRLRVRKARHSLRGPVRPNHEIRHALGHGKRLAHGFQVATAIHHLRINRHERSKRGQQTIAQTQASDDVLDLLAATHVQLVFQDFDPFACP